ncbi:2-haloalkanoic acid dehalogenase [Bosea sp. LC85]|uniref:HAD-IA family hydrolase n=1 Tax=Bosea sp. LC85 TaxID=1502851 RepID=UPI0004E43021|nr:HAD-IA family hydrolase [Bosea sp. LC85]KFC75926.1 2-haloalkanoic acid dehalogenase [Bosea sp. LC85]
MALRDFKVLTFDVVGTLIDFETGILNAVRRIGGPAAAKLSDDDIFGPYLKGRELNYERSSEVMGRVYIHLAKELGLPSDDATADAFQLAILRHPAFPDSVEALARLRKHFRLVAMTNADRSTFSFYSHALGNPFHDSVTADEAVHPKPDPLFFAFNRGRQAAFGYKQDEILHVAQSQYHDIGVAKSLGYTTCWIERRQGQKGFGGSPTVEITKPDYHFATLKALADAVEAEKA